MGTGVWLSSTQKSVPSSVNCRECHLPGGSLMIRVPAQLVSGQNRPAKPLRESYRPILTSSDPTNQPAFKLELPQSITRFIPGVPVAGSLLISIVSASVNVTSGDKIWPAAAFLSFFNGLSRASILCWLSAGFLVQVMYRMPIIPIREKVLRGPPCYSGQTVHEVNGSEETSCLSCYGLAVFSN